MAIIQNKLYFFLSRYVLFNQLTWLAQRELEAIIAGKREIWEGEGGGGNVAFFLFISLFLFFF